MSYQGHSPLVHHLLGTKPSACEPGVEWASCVNHDKNGFGGQRSLGLPGQLNELYAALAVFLFVSFPLRFYSCCSNTPLVVKGQKSAIF